MNFKYIPMISKDFNEDISYDISTEEKLVKVYARVYFPKLDNSLLQYSKNNDNKTFYKKLVLFPFFDIDNGNESITTKQL
jgi:hypothetical protein